VKKVAEPTVADGAWPRLLRRESAARYLGISVQQLDVLRASAEIDVVRMPGRLGVAVRTPLFDIQDLDRAVERWKLADPDRRVGRRTA
jgi:hypothetical protein